MNKKMPNKIILMVILLWSSLLLHGKNFDPDIEVKTDALEYTIDWIKKNASIVTQK